MFKRATRKKIDSIQLERGLILLYAQQYIYLTDIYGASQRVQIDFLGCGSIYGRDQLVNLDMLLYMNEPVSIKLSDAANLPTPAFHFRLPYTVYFICITIKAMGNHRKSMDFKSQRIFKPMGKDRI